MRALLRVVGLLAFAVAAVALVVGFAARFNDGPIGPFPGGPFRGTPQIGPEPSWAFVEPLREVDLQVDPSAPRSIRTWVLVHNGSVYIPAGLAARKQWPAQVEADGRVVLRAEGRLHERHAVRVLDAGLIAQLEAAIAEKYGTSLGGGGGTWFFRLEPPR